MKTQKMSVDSSETSQFPSPSPHGRYLKRRRFDALDSSSSNTSSNDSILGTHWELKRAKRELATLRTKLRSTEATIIEHHKLRKQTERLFEQEKNILEVQAQVDKETIKQMREDLETSVRSTHEAREAQAAANAELSHMKRIMEQRVAELVEANWKTQQESKLHNSGTKGVEMTISERLYSGRRTCDTRNVVFDNDVLQAKSQEEKKRAAPVPEKNTKKPSILFSKSSSGFSLNRIFLTKPLNRQVPLTGPNDSRASSSKISDKENFFPSAAPCGHKVCSTSYSPSSARVKYVDDSSGSSPELTSMY